MPPRSRTSRPLTNVQLVSHMMESSRCGGLKQAFIIEAILAYAKTVVASDVPWTNGFIDRNAWLACARECIDAIESRTA